jgi:tRNA pseudouridine38-40 synthase
MRNYMLIIQYDGTGYNGWQKQKNTTNTIQASIEQSLYILLQEEVEIHGSGRTDRGVHAKGQTANFKSKEICDLQEFLKELNGILPEDIKVIKIEEVDTNFHSRLSAVSKKYSYHVCYSDKPSVFRRKYVYLCDKNLNIKLMQEASKYLKGTHDFRGFSSEKNLGKSCIRNIYEITITEDKGELILNFFGSGFLYNMVRIMTGTLLEIGLGTLTIEDLNKALLTGKREYAGGMVPSNGLFLEQVFY